MLWYVQRTTSKNFAPKREEVPPGWIKMHNKELHGLYFSPYNAHMK
jgi:hypothetical protein